MVVYCLSPFKTEKNAIKVLVDSSDKKRSFYSCIAIEAVEHTVVWLVVDARRFT